MKSVPVPKGTTISISLLGSNYNKDVWGDDAFEFVPERWLRESASGGPSRPPKGKVVDEFAQGFGVTRDGEPSGVRGKLKYPGIYSSIMSFGGGPRACIGFRFAEMEVKQVITTLLSTLHFAVVEEKEIRWMSNNFQTPVVRPPGGDGKTRQVPLVVRKVKEGDFMGL